MLAHSQPGNNIGVLEGSGQAQAVASMDSFLLGGWFIVGMSIYI
jgi:hypothetical protein